MRFFLTIFLSFLFTVPMVHADFVDVTWDNIDREAILYLQQNGVVSGYADGVLDMIKRSIVLRY